MATIDVGATRPASTLSGDPVLRAYRGPQDHPAMSRVANAVGAFNGGRETRTTADMDNYYSRFDQAGLLLDCALAEIDGLVVAYGRASLEELASGGAAVWGILNIDPDHRGRGIETLLIDHAVGRAEQLATEHHVRLTLSVDVGERDPEQRAAAEAAGFRIVRQNAQLIRPNVDDIPEIGLPDRFEIRPIPADDPQMHRLVWEADARAFADSWGQEAPTEADYRRFVTSPTFFPPLWRVAFHADDIAGQILNYMDEQVESDGGRTGWTEAISVQPEFRRRGLARGLLAASLRAVRDAGATRAGLGVDLQNPNQARELYESMGYRIVSSSSIYELGPFPRMER